MDDLSEKLAEILNDPESMNRVREMAENLLGGSESSEQPSKNDINDSLFSGVDLGSIMSLMSSFKSAKGDNNTQLLSALKPHLSEPKREKVDTAIKILKLMELLPILKDSGLLNF